MSEAEATYVISELSKRIEENEKIWGPGCRPELRERLAAAQEIRDDFRYRRALGHGAVRVRSN